ncbi:ligand-gated channel protein [Marinomonas sp. M1K-6]|uniref:Ligand-gated channel protein n=1 Tax=Marinomonas profundi TaxID=2726122 RepID=A0A847R6D2_9GAMM|nr:ligand-gated channel protein [Marinomonas profundi]NLQ16464.1 ligand-gated channel protein [Marinomonas profundi]UDV03946.1 ligand-gated channel protein [Marinomonas profundi]
MTPSARHYKLTALAAIISAATHSATLLAEENTVDLDQLVVSASGHEQQITDAPASITVITQQNLEKKAYRDVTDALKDVPGVMVTGGGSTEEITMRGMSGKYTLILVDGKRQGSRETRPNSDGPGIEQGWTPPLSAIERIEVIRGPMSSLYGSDALGGVINIITKKVQDEWGGELSLGTTLQENTDSGNSQQADLMVSGPLVKDKLGLQLYGQISQRDEDKIVDGYADQEIKNATAKLSWALSEGQSLVFEAGKEAQNRTRHIGKSVATGPKASDSDTDYDREHYAITHTAEANGNHIETYVTHEEIDNPDRDMNYQNTVLNNRTALLFDDHVLTVGGQYDYQKLKDEGNKVSDGINELTRWNAALFVEDEYFVTDNLSVTGGLRYNEDENYGSNVSPRLYSNWSFTPDWTLKGGISTGYRSPDLRQGTDGWGQATGGGDAVILGNSDLKPEESTSHEIGLYWDNQQSTQISATIFHTNYKDKITETRLCDASCTYQGETYRFISERTNVDRVEMQGVELTLSHELTAALSVAANYTYTESEQKTGDFAGEPLNRLPKHMANATLNWDVTPKFTSWTRINYRGESSEGLSRTSMVEALPSYTFVDTGISYNINSALSVYAGVYNLLDKKVDTETYEKVLDGRRYNAKVKMTF